MSRSNKLMLLTLYLLSTSVFILTFADVNPNQQNQSLFTDVTQSANIQAPHVVTGKDLYGIGQCWGDYDNDGYPDLYVTNFEGPNTLYRNKGDGTFEISTYSTQVNLALSKSSGCSWADYDNDGDKDLLVLAYGVNSFFENTNNGFSEVDMGWTESQNSQTGSWGDFDNDGNLDLFISNWKSPNVTNEMYSGNEDHLYRNNGDGSFEDVTYKYLQKELVRGAGFVGSFVDYDNDNDLDIYVVNDMWDNPVGNILWRNDGDKFTDVSKAAGANIKLYGMGLAIADIDNDLDLDFFFSNMGKPVLLVNNGDGTFTNSTNEMGINLYGEMPITWGSTFFDYDNDMLQDLVVARMDDSSPLFNNKGNVFYDMKLTSGIDVSDAQTVNYVDYNRDGFLDLMIGQRNGNFKLFENNGAKTASNSNNWITIKLDGGEKINKDAVGSRVYINTSSGKTLMQELKIGSSLGGNNEAILHFGLGSDTISTMKIVWSDGETQNVVNSTMNNLVEIVYSPDSIDNQSSSTDTSTESDSPGLTFLLTLNAIVLISIYKKSKKNRK